MKRRWVALSLFAAASAIVILVVILISQSRPTDANPPGPEAIPQVPDNADVVQISAELFGTNKETRKVPRYSVPAKYFPAILDAMRPAERPDISDDKDTLLGSVSITTKAGKTVEVTFGFSGKNPLCFRIDGVSSVRGGKYKSVWTNVEHYLPECMMLAAIISEIEREEKTGERTEYLNLYC
ncbi:MAG: hypothetical protein HY289_15755 [Planctomycetes bacterium]|nr:hypothetical protein [Planctomycetota bacterium]